MAMHRINVGNELATPNLREDIDKVKDNLRETSSSIYQTYQDAKGIAQATVSDSIKNIKDKSDYAQKNVRVYVKTNPLKTVVFAMLAGLISAKLIKL